MSYNDELRREIKVLREKIRDGQDAAMIERRRQQELDSAMHEARAARASKRGF